MGVISSWTGREEHRKPVHGFLQTLPTSFCLTDDLIVYPCCVAVITHSCDHAESCESF